MKTPSDTVQAAQRLLAEREAVGLKKYGTTVDRTDLQAGDWLQHAIEEASDLLLYLIRLRGTIPRVTYHPRPGPLDSDPSEAERNMRAKEAEAEAERAAYLARWKDAPEWAEWLGEDDDGECAWFDRKPRNHVIVGWHIEDGRAERAVPNLLGSVKCEPRPRQGEGQGVEG